MLLYVMANIHIIQLSFEKLNFQIYLPLHLLTNDNYWNSSAIKQILDPSSKPDPSEKSDPDLSLLKNQVQFRDFPKIAESGLHQQIWIRNS